MEAQIKQDPVVDFYLTASQEKGFKKAFPDVDVFRSVIEQPGAIEDLYGTFSANPEFNKAFSSVDDFKNLLSVKKKDSTEDSYGVLRDTPPETGLQNLQEQPSELTGEEPPRQKELILDERAPKVPDLGKPSELTQEKAEVLTEKYTAEVDKYIQDKYSPENNEELQRIKAVMDAEYTEWVEMSAPTGVDIEAEREREPIWTEILAKHSGELKRVNDKAADEYGLLIKSMVGEIVATQEQAKEEAGLLKKIGVGAKEFFTKFTPSTLINLMALRPPSPKEMALRGAGVGVHGKGTFTVDQMVRMQQVLTAQQIEKQRSPVQLEQDIGKAWEEGDLKGLTESAISAVIQTGEYGALLFLTGPMGLYATSMGDVYGELVAKSVENGKSLKEAISAPEEQLTSIIAGSIIGLLESTGLYKIAAVLSKTLTSSIKKKLVGVATAMLVEGVTEGLQETTQATAAEMTDKELAAAIREVFGSPEKRRRLFNAFWMGFIGGGGIAGGGATISSIITKPEVKAPKKVVEKPKEPIIEVKPEKKPTVAKKPKVEVKPKPKYTLKEKEITKEKAKATIEKSKKIEDLEGLTIPKTDKELTDLLTKKTEEHAERVTPKVSKAGEQEVQAGKREVEGVRLRDDEKARVEAKPREEAIKPEEEKKEEAPTPEVKIDMTRPLTKAIQGVLRTKGEGFSTPILIDGKEGGSVDVIKRKEGWDILDIHVDKKKQGTGSRVVNQIREAAEKAGTVLNISKKATDGSGLISGEMQSLLDSFKKRGEVVESDYGWKFKPTVKVEAKKEAKVAEEIKKPIKEVEKEEIPIVDAVKEKQIKSMLREAEKENKAAKKDLLGRLSAALDNIIGKEELENLKVGGESLATKEMVFNRLVSEKSPKELNEILKPLNMKYEDNLIKFSIGKEGEATIAPDMLPAMIKRIKRGFPSVVPPGKLKEKLISLKEKKDITSQSIAGRLERLGAAFGGIQRIEGKPNDKEIREDIIGLAEDIGAYAAATIEGAIVKIQQFLTESGLKVPDDVIKSAIQDKYAAEGVKKAPQATISEKPPKPPIEKKKAAVAPKAPKEKVRGIYLRALKADKTEQQKVVSDIADANKETYKTIGYEEAIRDAKKLIDKLGGWDPAYKELIQKTTDLDALPQRTVGRLILINFYSGVLGDSYATEESKRDAYLSIVELQKISGREGTPTGRSNAYLGIWKSMQPAGTLEFVKRTIDKFNELRLKRLTTDGIIDVEALKAAEKVLQESSVEVADAIATAITKMTIKDSRANLKGSRKLVTQKRLTILKSDHKKLIEEYKRRKKESGAAYSTIIPGVTQLEIEMAGKFIANYLARGYYLTSQIVDNLKTDMGLNDKQIDAIMDAKYGKNTLSKILKDTEQKQGELLAQEEVNNAVADIVRGHWAETDVVKRTLTQKFSEDLGFSSEVANKLEKFVLDEFDKKFGEAVQAQATKLYGMEIIPTKRKRKGTLDKIMEAAHLGALTDDFYRQLVAEKLGLAPELTTEQGAKITRLAENVQQLEGMGEYTRLAIIDLAQYTDGLFPRTRGGEFIDLWIGMNYAAMLAGPSTHNLNILSAGTNIAAKPIKDPLNLSKWVGWLRGKKAPPIFNPFGEIWTALLGGARKGSWYFREVWKHGSMDSKYIEQVTHSDRFKIQELERPKYGIGKRFPPIRIKIKGRTSWDLNIFNHYKYVGRLLQAEDRFMFNISFDIEIADILRDKYYIQGLRGKKLRNAIMDEHKSRRVNMEDVDKQVNNQSKKFEELTGKKLSDIQKKIRKREILLDAMDLTTEEKTDADRLARSNIFTDDRYGAIGRLTRVLGEIINMSAGTQVSLKPFIWFTKIIGNVTEFMLDASGVYGIMRSNGLGLTSMVKWVTGGDFETSQMGRRGSRPYYEQMGRAWLGVFAQVIFGLASLGNDEDSDDFIVITGGRHKEGWKKAGRQSVMPNYTIRIGGRNGLEIGYLNIPLLAISFALIGNLNDELQLSKMKGEGSLSFDEIWERLTVAMLMKSTFNSVIMVKDMAIVSGVEDFLTNVIDALRLEEGPLKKLGRDLLKRYSGLALRPLPQNVNLVRQIAKIFDRTSYSQQDIKAILQYQMGIQHFYGYPSLDVLGKVIETWPGETQMPYPRWLKLKKREDTWAFMAKYNAIPSKVTNYTPILVEKDTEKRKLEVEELYRYSKLAGEKFNKGLLEYMKGEDIEGRAEDIEVRYTKEVSGVQYDLDVMWEAAKNDAKSELFEWGMTRSEMPETWQEMVKKKVVFPYKRSHKIEIDGERQALTKSQLYTLNCYMGMEYAQLWKNAGIKYMEGEEYTAPRKKIDDKWFSRIELLARKYKTNAIDLAEKRIIDEGLFNENK